MRSFILMLVICFFSLTICTVEEQEKTNFEKAKNEYLEKVKKMTAEIEKAIETAVSDSKVNPEEAKKIRKLINNFEKEKEREVFKYYKLSEEISIPYNKEFQEALYLYIQYITRHIDREDGLKKAFAEKTGKDVKIERERNKGTEKFGLWLVLGGLTVIAGTVMVTMIGAIRDNFEYLLAGLFILAVIAIVFGIVLLVLARI